MKINRLEKRIERLQADNERLRNEKQELLAQIAEYKDKEVLLDETIAEYQRLVTSVKKSQEYYSLLLSKLREYDGKMTRKYKKAVNAAIKYAE